MKSVRDEVEKYLNKHEVDVLDRSVSYKVFKQRESRTITAIIRAVTRPITEEWLKELQAESAYESEALHKTLHKFTITGYIRECAKAIREGLGGK